MLANYFILDLMPDATDEEIRINYLKLVKKYTPEKYPEKFKTITKAYESIKDKRRRISMELFSYRKSIEVEEELLALAKSRVLKKRQTNLRDFL
jgi:DnaJ-class molecular chaperone